MILIWPTPLPLPSPSIAFSRSIVIFGPVAQHMDSLDNLNTSSAAVYAILAGKDADVPPTG